MTVEAVSKMSGDQDVEAAVKNRYADGAAEVQAALCCPIDDYNPELLEILPDEILEKDYGCGDPSKFVNKGDVVLDLGSGGGKICYITSQLVGPEGEVIGVDFNPAMLDLARKYEKEMGDVIGWHNVSFRKGRIQDLALNLDLLQSFLDSNPVPDLEGLDAVQAEEQRLRSEAPLIPTGSVDIVLSNCVLNLVSNSDKKQLFEEIFRVLKRGGRVAISDIVCDEDVPEHLQADPELWSGCISGAFREDAFLKAFEEVGFYGVDMVKREEEPWQVVEGIEFRSVTVTAYKGKEGPCLERNQALIYKGPFKQVLDDDGHFYERGQLTAVCEKTFDLFSKAPYSQHFYPVQPRVEIPADQAQEFDCDRVATRSPKELKGLDYSDTTQNCGPSSGCC